MNETEFKFSKYDLNFLIKLKRTEFQTKENYHVSDQQIKDYLFKIKWNHVTSVPMCELIDDIMNLKFSDLFDYLSLQAVKEASSLNMSAFQDLISK